MTEQADSNIVDVFKERLASPFLFTFFWVSCTWNWKVIYWFLYEPLKPSLKLVRIPFEWGVWWPILITVVVITVVPWINNAVEIIKQYAEHNLNLWLHKLKWKKMVTEAEYQKLVDEVVQLKDRQHKLVNDNSKAQASEQEAKEALISVQEDNNKNLSLLSKLEGEKADYSTNLQDAEKDNKRLSAKVSKLEKQINEIEQETFENINELKDVHFDPTNTSSRLLERLYRSNQYVKSILTGDEAEWRLHKILNKAGKNK
tara:strand:+ start:345 stop:1118 length:774 start_codon:yes stop_codon:yes gene_type:complete